MLWLTNDPTEQATHIGIAFDNPIRSFRNDLFDDYKSDEGVEPELRAQFDLAEEAAKALGFVVWSMDRYEADDALATAALRFAGEVDQVSILTPDKDLGQVLRGKSVVQVDRIRKKEIDEAHVLSVRGVGPASIPDLLALIGDTADGIPGLPGFGEKTAAALLRKYGHLEGIPDAPEGWPGEVRGRDRLAATLRERGKTRSSTVGSPRLSADVPLTERLDDLRWRGAPRASFDALKARLNTEELRPSKWA